MTNDSGDDCLFLCLIILATDRLCFCHCDLNEQVVERKCRRKRRNGPVVWWAGLRIEITTIDMGFQFKSIFVACQSEVALCCLKRNAVLHLDPIHSSIKTPVTFFCRSRAAPKLFFCYSSISIYCSLFSWKWWESHQMQCRFFLQLSMSKKSLSSGSWTATFLKSSWCRFSSNLIKSPFILYVPCKGAVLVSYLIADLLGLRNSVGHQQSSIFFLAQGSFRKTTLSYVFIFSSGVDSFSNGLEFFERPPLFSMLDRVC